MGGIKLSPRSGVSITTGPGNLAYSFGGVYDEEESEEDICGKFFNDLNVIDLEKRCLRQGENEIEGFLSYSSWLYIFKSWQS